MRRDASDTQAVTPAAPPQCAAGDGGDEAQRVRALVSRLSAREEAAWDYMWERYAATTLGLIHHLVRTRNWFALSGWEEDVLTESFARLMRGIAKFRGQSESELDHFVRANTVFACLQKLRDMPGREEPTALEAAAGGGSPETLQEAADCARLLRAAIDDLPPNLRAIIYLNLAGCEAREVAIRLGVPVRSVYDRKHRALRLLRERLAREEFWEQCAPYVSDIRLTLREELA